MKDAIYQRAKHLPIQLVPISQLCLSMLKGMAGQLAVIEELLALESYTLCSTGNGLSNWH